MGWQVGNIYVIAATAVIGGGLFGFDISSMSAILGTQAYRCYFNQQDVDRSENPNGLCGEYIREPDRLELRLICFASILRFEK